MNSPSIVEFLHPKIALWLVMMALVRKETPRRRRKVSRSPSVRAKDVRGVMMDEEAGVSQ